MTWKEYKDWVEGFGVKDDIVFDPNIEWYGRDGMMVKFDTFEGKPRAFQDTK